MREAFRSVIFNIAAVFGGVSGWIALIKHLFSLRRKRRQK